MEGRAPANTTPGLLMATGLSLGGGGGDGSAGTSRGRSEDREDGEAKRSQGCSITVSWNLIWEVQKSKARRPEGIASGELQQQGRQRLGLKAA